MKILHVKVEIESGEATPAQLKNWRELWAKLLQGKEQAKDEAGEGKNGNEAVK